MPADITKAKDFLLTTDFPLDKITYLTTGSFNISPYGSPGSIVTVTFPHNLPSMPLVNMVWSDTPNFITSYMSGSSPSPIDITRNIVGVQNTIYASATDIVIDASNFLNNGFTFYYRIYGFEKSGETNDYNPTSNASDDFILNTDYNYTKLYIDTSTTVATNNIIPHNLSYISQIEAFIERPAGFGNPRRVSPPELSTNSLDTTGSIGDQGFINTVTSLQYAYISPPTTEVMHARIYLDD